MNDLKTKTKICKNGVLQILEPRDSSQLQLFDIGKYKLKTLKFDKVWREQGFIKVMKNGKYGLYDSTGKELFAPEYVDIEICALGFVVYYNSDITSEFYDKNGKKHEQLRNSNVIKCFTKHKILFVNFFCEVCCYALYSLENDEFLTAKWSMYLDSKNKLFLCNKLHQSAGQVLCKSNGALKNVLFFTDIHRKVSYALEKGKAGSFKTISATKCQELVKPVYGFVYSSGDEASIVIKKRCFGLVNHDGTTVLPCKYGFVIEDHYSKKAQTYYLFGYKNLWGLASSSEVLLDAKYSKIYPISEHVYCVQQEDKKWKFDCKTKSLEIM